ncbi:hypothetical protein TrST_g11108 [Triparma strigata]|uniref:GPI inositol-deacylase n=1 Tax=Triparma strigata TaxID=1606541 RepID=A0A9W7BGC1_9STRA|nr:hypothetical protein TrST_g11108 [Triparma strigata]
MILYQCLFLFLAYIPLTQPLSLTTATNNKPHVLILPAQFLVPADYASLERTLVADHGFPSATTTPLTRLDWLKVIPSSPADKFIKGTLDPKQTLKWYYGKIETQLSQILREHPPDTQPDGVTKVALVGHSIGGWVARSFIGGLYSADTAVGSLLKSHQTRGLLKFIEEEDSCSPAAMGIPISNIASSGIKGKIFSTDLESLVAASGYWSLNGDLFSEGDGIVPVSVASIDAPAKVLKDVKHAGSVPTPWNIFSDSKSIELSEEAFGKWYGSPSVVSEWSELIV